jgi:RNA polymerase sigma-70 factor (ECF subfamily)
MDMHADTSDRELVDAVRNGDTRAFRGIVERYESQVAATVIGMLGRGEEARDVGQEVFIRFYRTVGRFRGDSAVGTYLTRIAINLSLNALKRRSRERSRYGGSPDEVHGLSDERCYAEEHEKGTAIRRAMLSLAPRFRSVAVLRLVKGHSTRETADLLGLPLGTVLSRLSRAQRALAEALMEYRGG